MKCSNVLVVIICLVCLLVSGCNRNGLDLGISETDGYDLVSLYDYSDWYGDMDNSDTYNCALWIELDVWYKEKISDYDLTDTTYNVSFNGQIIASNIAISYDVNYMTCYFDTEFDGAVLTSYGFLAPGNYEISVMDSKGSLLTSSTCCVTAETGDKLSKMVTGVEQIKSPENQVALRVSFDSDITPYSKTGFYISVSLDGGETNFKPQEYSIELADTYMTVRYYLPESSAPPLVISVYCGDNSFVCKGNVG